MGCCGSCGGQDSNLTKEQDKDQVKAEEQKPVASQENEKTAQPK
ncbi:MAG: hypothetical protein OQL08_06365 [Gammaproteobacteria bacterium]|nr:hypothetical protein [Gammaproteobacteria bacterium]